MYNSAQIQQYHGNTFHVDHHLYSSQNLFHMLMQHFYDNFCDSDILLQ